jgi:hypothetical protein
VFANYNHNKVAAISHALLIPGRQTPVLFQPIDQPFYPLAETVDGPIKRTGPIFILLPRDGDTDTVASQVLPNLSTTVGFVPHQTTVRVHRVLSIV